MCDLSPPCPPVRTPLLEQIMCKLMKQDCVAMQPILNSLDRIRVLADTVNTHYQEPEFWRQEDDLSPLHMIGPVTHTLLSVPRVNPEADDVDPTELFREMARLAMLFLLAALKRMYSFFLDEIEFTTLTAKFGSVLLICQQDHSIYQHDGSFYRLKLWALLTVAALQQFADRALYVTEIRRCMSYLDIESATDAFQLSREIAWIDVIGGTDTENGSLMNAIDNATPPP
jgi:hypothetical protein